MEKNTSSASPAETPWRSFLGAFPASQSNSVIFDKSIKAVYYRNIPARQTARGWRAGNPGRTSEEDRKGHLFSWSLTEDLTSSHDITSVGSVSWSAKRRSSSTRCGSVSETASPCAAMLTQSFSASDGRSSSPSRSSPSDFIEIAIFPTYTHPHRACKPRT